MDESLKNRILEIFEKEQAQLDNAFKAQSSGVTAPKKFNKTTIIQSDDGTYSKNVEEVDSNFYDDSVVGSVEAEIKNDAATLQEFCKEFDDRILSFNAQINAKKQQLVTLSTEAISRNCWPGIAYSTLFFGGIFRQTDPLLAATQNFGNPYIVIEDREALEIYDKMSGPNVDYGAGNPFEPSKIVTLTPLYSGFGHETQRDNGRLEPGDAATEVVEDDYNVGGDNPGEEGDENYPPGNEYLNSFQSSLTLGTGRTDISTTESDHIGPRNVGLYRAYAGVGVAPEAIDTSLIGTDGADRCVAIASSISTIISEIKVLRQQRDVAVNRVNLNTIKDKKMNKELQNWGIENIKAKQNQRKTSNSSAISAVNDM